MIPMLLLLRMFIILSILLSVCHSSPVSLGSGDIVTLIRSGERRLVDARSDTSREVFGYIEGSILASEYHKEDPHLSMEEVIFIVDREDTVVEEICTDGVLCYQGDLAPFQEMLTFPQEVTFQSLSILLKDNRITLLDVRNSSELVNPGKIPGSVNIPLHEIPGAFLLDPEMFLEKYNFPVPDTGDSNVVITCRSGRRARVAIKRLEPLGFTRLRIYPGSFIDWVERGGVVVGRQK